MAAKRSTQALRAGKAVSDWRTGGLIAGTSGQLLASIVQDLAREVDRNSTNAAMWSQYRAAVADLRREVAGRVDSSDGPTGDPIDDLLAELGGGPEVRDEAAT